MGLLDQDVPLRGQHHRQCLATVRSREPNLLPVCEQQRKHADFRGHRREHSGGGHQRERAAVQLEHEQPEDHAAEFPAAQHHRSGGVGAEDRGHPRGDTHHFLHRQEQRADHRRGC